MSKRVLVSGNFNILHPGHLRLLRFAKECGNILIVAVNSDRIAQNKAHVPQGLRLDGVKSIGWVDEALIWDGSTIELIKTVKPDIVVKGREHENYHNQELEPLSAYGGKLLFSSGESIFSTMDLLKAEFFRLERFSIGLPTSFMERHAVSIDRLTEIVKNFSKLKVCVVGDLIVDEYITCDSLGMSQEDPTIVVTPIDTSQFIGGAGIVAAHAAGLGANVSFITVSGNDEAYLYAKSQLSGYGVNAEFIIDETRPTTLKKRYRSKGKTLLRVSHLHQGSISLEHQELFLNLVEKNLLDCNILVFSDFNYGCLPQKLVDRIITHAKGRGIFMAADSQSSSQVGDIGRFVGMDLITPTEREARISTRNYIDGLTMLAEKIRIKSLAENILLKLGEEGALIHTRAIGESAHWHTDQIGALNQSAKDPAGAGDSLLITSSMALASGGSIWEAALLGSLAAAIQVGRVGNTPIKLDELQKEFY